jgi:hypothetical protein
LDLRSVHLRIELTTPRCMPPISLDIFLICFNYARYGNKTSSNENPLWVEVLQNLSIFLILTILTVLTDWLSKGKVVVKSIFVSHLRMESHDEFKSGGKCCGDESPSTSSEDTVNEERLAGDK